MAVTTTPAQPAARQAVRSATGGERFAAGLLALGCLAVLIAAAWLSPDPAGHGTHTQLGLSACSWAEYFDAPCATCGMTTSFAYAADNRWGSALTAQPFGALLAALTAIVFWGAAHVAATGSRLGAALAPALSTRVLIVGVALFLGAWVYKWLVW
ncbi:MAG: DUF2752 domain-containing protein [Phycisphaeraceae bacterium]|nr:DUF2752 domain-containing protein [Phycisphaeraceae bacterium]